MTIPRKINRKALIKKLDDIFSQYIRRKTVSVFKEYNCVFCHKRPITNCFHFLSRRHYATRWDEENAIGSCWPCNFDERHHPDKYRAWFLKRFGMDKYLEIEAKSRQLTDFSVRDLQLMYADIKQKYEKIEAGIKEA